MHDSHDYPQGRNITVSGKGMVKATPDLAMIDLSVITENKDVLVAQQENARISQQVITALVGSGIPREQIQTADYSVLPQYDYQNNTQQLTGYRVIHTFSVSTSVNQIGTVIDIATKNGVNQVRNITLTVSNQSYYYQEAIRRAIQHACTTAQTIAQCFQVTLNAAPYHVLEQSTNTSPVLYKTYATAESSTATPIQPGQLEIEADVKIQFNFSC
ncbi:SIMPL domain-containing protein [Gracilibacillus salinarum]|uniref:SIMPL domain-containing protein n=1 Tax=Gracilibacillus salinarum TaxID=2932255 RepID=A0ABY4GHU4_9BACI|nr:SIMPL domain-containing protein [Gracilibacillus salinarum]UOQ83342.1 SIMPL domain-containing protein [Gracilibacillus salinarum]